VRQAVFEGDYARADALAKKMQRPYGQDVQFLGEFSYPLMKGTAEFCLDWLIEDGGAPGHLPLHLCREHLRHGGPPGQ
jgi:hypothetical protein